MAQDTGGAIVGAVRADYFWGWGEGAEERAGRMKQPLRLWVLAPRDAANPTSNLNAAAAGGTAAPAPPR
jgi:membrane-bound lytic murein transglycosylase A